MLGIMLSIMFVVSSLERMLPPLPFIPPGSRIGMANIVVMYTVFIIGAKEAFMLNFLKAALISLSRGLFAGSLSLAGGMLSVCIIVILVKIGNKASIIMISVAGALAHNLGQLTIFYFIIGMPATMYYLPFLLIASIFFGMITGVTLNMIMPAIYKQTTANRQRRKAE